MIDGVPLRPVTTRNDNSEHSITVAEANFERANVFVTFSFQKMGLPKFVLTNFERFRTNCKPTRIIKNTSTITSLLKSKSIILILLSGQRAISMPFPKKHLNSNT